MPLIGLTTTLFDFVSLRGVQRKPPSAHSMVAATAPSGFVPHAALRPNASAKLADAKTTSPAPVAAFEQTAEYQADLRGVLDYYDDLLETGVQLRQLRAQSDAADLSGRFSKITPLKDAQAFQLWNNLIYQALYGIDAMVYDELASVALANYVATQFSVNKEGNTPERLLALSTATIALPRGVLARPAEPVSPQTPKPDAQPGKGPTVGSPAAPRLVLDRGSIWQSAILADAVRERPWTIKPRPTYNPFPHLPCCMKILNVAEYRRVQQTLVRYEPGEIAAIVNIMQGEYQERSTRHLLKTEDSLLTSSDTETTHESDTQTTDRFEMESATKKALASSLDWKLGAKVSGSYGTTSFEISAEVASHNSSTQSDEQAVKKSKEITAKALDQVISQVRQERQSRRTEEFEDKFIHGYDNRAGSGHVVGSYRWVNKVYSAQVWTYGRRLSACFFVDEPASFYKFSSGNSPAIAGLTPPTEPSVKVASELNETNYLAVASGFGLDLQGPPEKFIYISQSYSGTGPEGGTFGLLDYSGADKPITIPIGYTAVEAEVHSSYLTGEETNGYLQLAIAGMRLNGFDGNLIFPVPGISGSLTPSFIGRAKNHYISICVKCKVSDATMWSWQSRTYAAIMANYQSQQESYEAKVAEAQARASSMVFSADDFTISRIITTEIKKACLRILGPDKDLPLVGDEQFHHCDKTGQDVPLNRTECPFCRDAQRAALVESLFDWELMITRFYEYYYADTCRWAELNAAKGSDAAMTAFLQAGFAKVTVPVADGKEAAFLYYMATGHLWGGDDAPVFDDPIILDMLAEVQPIPEPLAIGDPWEMSVPTTLTALECGSKCIIHASLPLIGTECSEVNPLAGKDVALPSPAAPVVSSQG